MRQTFTMSIAQFDKLLESMQPVPYMVFDGMAPRSRQENANDAWAALGKEMGFDSMSVRPGASKLEFTAEPAAAIASQEAAAQTKESKDV